ncbi:hypothetical protein Cob_v003665 [Colletotrichum orbiculare MAFF 240422]|uniref:Uncharacterized protein n=1 Tax=Colletotrichum orbiculare (strain 104-T / ATCC 96160 / CBS 514.97 / LARS 414 / MAFF 240422) TaxID=1213857 RepID=N4VI39_COLOR|nr:hypothetical protein Cob_v003665 [Colletotrichum orbiculare MAFF 240422]
MGFLLRFVTGLAMLSSVANARLYEVPEATTIFNLPLDQFSPQPTKAPAYADLKRRQASTTTTVLVAPDNTCGYISGRAGAAYTCGSAANCVFFTASGRNPGRVACCDAAECGARRTCYDRNQVSSSSLCNDGCLVDQFTLKCTASSRPFCNTVSFSGSVFDYWCNSLEISTAQAAQTTYDGETGRTWAPLALTDDASSSVLRPPSASGRFTATATGSPADPVASSPTDNDGDNGTKNKSSTPVGAIVGGVIGGIALIALIGLGIFLILRKKKQNPQQQQQQQQQPPQQQMAQGGGYASPPLHQQSPDQYAATTHTQSFYDPKFGGGAGYAPSYGGTPPPQGGFQQPGVYYNGSMVPDRADTTSPGAVSQVTDNRFSTQTIAPVYPQQRQPHPTIHEAPANNDGHKGQMHELA